MAEPEVKDGGSGNVEHWLQLVKTVIYGIGVNPPPLVPLV